MGNARRRKAKNGSRHDINDQSQSQGERSIQDVKLDKLRKPQRPSSLRQPAKKRCGNCLVVMTVLLFALASSAVYVYNYVDTAPLIDTLKVQTVVVIETLQQKYGILLNYNTQEPPRRKSGDVKSDEKSEETRESHDLGREKDIEPVKEETKDARTEDGAPTGKSQFSEEEGSVSDADRDGGKTQQSAEKRVVIEDEEIREKEEEILGVGKTKDGISLEEADRDVEDDVKDSEAVETPRGRRSATSGEDANPQVASSGADTGIDTVPDTGKTESPVAEDSELINGPPNDNIEQMDEDAVPPSDDIEQTEQDAVSSNDNIEQAEEDAMPPSDNIEQTEEKAEPPSDDLEQTEDEAEPLSDNIEKTEDEAELRSDDMEQMDEGAEPPSDHIEQTLEEAEPPSDHIEQSEDKAEQPSDDIEHTEDEAEPPSDYIEQMEEEAESPSDYIEQTEEEAEPPSDSIEQTEDKAEPSKDDIAQTEDKAEPSKDDTEQTEDKAEPSKDDIEQMEDEAQSPSDDIEQTEDEAQPPSDDTEQTEDEAQPPSDDIKQTEDEAEPSNDDIEQTEHEAVPPGDKDRYKTPGDKAEHTPDTTGAKEQESMKTQVKQETEDAADVTADSSDEEDQSGHRQVRYHNAHITNQEDFEIREKLDAADRLLQQKQVQEGRVIFEQLLSLHPQSPRATYGRALALDIEADLYRSNALLEQAITEYLRVLELPDVPKALMILSGRKCSTRQTFRGWVNRAVTTMKKIVTLFPEELDLWSELGVQYLIRGSNSEAREAFLQVLQRRPDDGFAKVHLGFIIKVVDRDYDKSIPYLQQGIDSGVPGTIDGRFFVHLGDALYRVGRHNEAQKVYDLGYKKEVFMSPLQRSLHNVERLTAHPWWTAEETGVKERLKLLEENWEVIRDEGLAQLNDTTGAFELEAEDLRDKGEWRQFTLYRQGHKVPKNCRRTPKTCELLDQFPEATSCKRGQIKYSVMHPGIHVWPHCGPTNCRIRAHLGLVVPPGLRIRVVNETRSWTEGRFIVFDDSFDHEVWHEGNSLRLVLIVDIWHPELTTRERTTLPPI